MTTDKANRPDSREDSVRSEHADADLQRLQEQKAQFDTQFQDKMERLAQEKAAYDQQFEERLTKLRQEEQYKDDLLEERISRLNEERQSHDHTYQEKIARLQQEQAAAEKDYLEKIERVRMREAEADEKHQEKMRKASEEIQLKIDELNIEILRLEKLRQEKLAEVKSETHYKKRILEDRDEFIRDWEEAKQTFNRRMAELQQHKIDMDQEYEQKTNLLRTEIQHNDTGLQEKIEHLQREKQVHMELIQDKITQVQQEKMRQDELYKIQLEKIQQDHLYQERMNRLKDDTLMIERTHAETQQQLLRERETMEESIARNRESNRISSLKRMREIEKEFEVADKHLDVRSWPVIGNRGEKIGIVQELIVDVEAMKVRYLDVNVLADNNRHVLIPIGAATIDKNSDFVLVPNLDSAMVMKFPSYTGETVTRDYERTLLTTLSPEYNLRSGSQEDFYKQEPFNDKGFYERRTGKR